MHTECSRCGSNQPVFITCETCYLEFCFSCSDIKDIDCCPACGTRNILTFVI